MPDTSGRAPYDPKTTRLLSFHDAVPRFKDGSDTPRAYLERCLATIEAREPTVQAFATLNIASARQVADASTARYKAGRPLSVVDGMPFGIKDLFETFDMPTQMNSPYYKGWQGPRDCAHAYVMRKGGASILGKTTTTEFGSSAPPPTRNPFDERRTAGGSSSGTSAAVGAMMLPAASGSQVRGSIMRPAGYSANYALKPTFGGLNRGGGHSISPSQSVLGVHAGSLEDCWNTAFYISSTAGGDPGQPGLYGEPAIGAARKIGRVVRLDTLGWDGTTPETRAAFDRFCAELGRIGVAVVSRKDDPAIEDFERALRTIPDFLFPILGYEGRWPLADYEERRPGTLSAGMLEAHKRGLAVTVEQYREHLKTRATIRARYEALRGKADAFVLLCQQDPAPIGMGIGNPVYGDVSSTLACPAFALPLLAVEGMPVGVQLMGWPHDDYALACMAKWLMPAALGAR